MGLKNASKFCNVNRISKVLWLTFIFIWLWLKNDIFLLNRIDWLILIKKCFDLNCINKCVWVILSNCVLISPNFEGQYFFYLIVWLAKNVTYLLGFMNDSTLKCYVYFLFVSFFLYKSWLKIASSSSQCVLLYMNARDISIMFINTNWKSC